MSPFQPGVVDRIATRSASPRARALSPEGGPAQVDAVADFVASNPALVVLVVFLLGFVFFAYLFVRRTVTGLRDGFDEGYRGK